MDKLLFSSVVLYAALDTSVANYGSASGTIAEAALRLIVENKEEPEIVAAHVVALFKSFGLTNGSTNGALIKRVAAWGKGAEVIEYYTAERAADAALGEGFPSLNTIVKGWEVPSLTSAGRKPKVTTAGTADNKNSGKADDPVAPIPSPIALLEALHAAAATVNLWHNITTKQHIGSDNVAKLQNLLTELVATTRMVCGVK